MHLRFYQCAICEKVSAVLTDTDIPSECCGQEMDELIPNRTDGAFEKHIPVFCRKGNTVRVKIGSLPHPMTPAHSILWIGLHTSHGFLFHELLPEDEPECRFFIGSEEKIRAVYAFCNLHGLWCSEKEAELPASACTET